MSFLILYYLGGRGRWGFGSCSLLAFHGLVSTCCGMSKSTDVVACTFLKKCMYIYCWNNSVVMDDGQRGGRGRKVLLFKVFFPSAVT